MSVDAEIRCEWGRPAAEIADVDVAVVIDVLSFSTCVDAAVARGATVYPFPMAATASPFAEALGAICAGKRSQGGLSLSPPSLAALPDGARLVLPSPNGSYLSALCRAPTVLAGCLRNAGAVAAEAARRGRRILLIPAAERWPGGGTRFALEDWLGAGAVAAALPGRLSPEAEAAKAAFLAVAPRIGDVLADTPSGRELAETGFERDVAWASRIDASRRAPLLRRSEARYGDLAALDGDATALAARPVCFYQDAAA